MMTQGGRTILGLFLKHRNARALSGGHSALSHSTFSLRSLLPRPRRESADPGSINDLKIIGAIASQNDAQKLIAWTMGRQK
jgi:hypothetical protein